MESRKRARDTEVNMPVKSARRTNGHVSEASNGAPSSRDAKEDDRLAGLAPLYAASVNAKLWATAQKALAKPAPPTLFPEYTSPGGTEYIYRELDFWTSGFFPGALHALLERQRRYSHLLGNQGAQAKNVPHLMQFACKWWTDNLHQNATLSTTHDIGFMITPWARRAWELNHDVRAYNTLCTAAHTLASRYSPVVGCIRSWDVCVTKDYKFDDLDADFLVIIDNIMNLDLLFTAASYTGSQELRDIAVAHARTTQKTHVRKDFSTTHLVVLDPATGAIKRRLTNQGFSHTSCWARGQAWAIAGFAETYQWTLDEEFLDTARGCADFFLRHLPESSVPPWDFDAQDKEGGNQPRDTSAALIAAYGLLLIEQAHRARGQPSAYLDAALRIVSGVSKHHLNAPAAFRITDTPVETVEHGVVHDSLGVEVTEQCADNMRAGETIVNGATINNYVFAPRRWADHGLVYADYYFVVVGNKLLEMGIGGRVVDRKQ